MDVVQDLLRIKLFREQQAERALLKARAELAEATEHLKQRQVAMKEFSEESIQREKSLYADLCSRLVFLKDIENVRIDIDLMKEKAIELKNQVDAADQKRNECIEREAAALLVHIHAVRAREKFDELLKSFKEEVDAVNNHKEELEMEEAASVRFSMQAE
jgi:type III secretion protein O